MELNQFFPAKVCINLDRRPERWERVTQRFQQHAICGVERFSAIDGRAVPNPPGWQGPPGAFACGQSHLAVVRQAKAAGVQRLLILEDDVVFDERLSERFSKRIGGLPKKWDMLYFGSLLQKEPSMVSPGIGRVQKAHSTFAYALNNTVFDAFIEINTGATQPVDNNNTLLQERFRCYSFFPFLAWVESGYSDVEGVVVNHWQIRESLVLKSAEMGRILAETCVIVTPRLEGSAHINVVQLEFLVDSILSMNSEISMVILQPPFVDGGALASWKGNSRIEIFEQETGKLEAPALLAARAQKKAGKEYFFFTDSDLHLRRPDLKGCLQMARRHKFVRPFSSVIRLSEDGTRNLLAGRMRWIDESSGNVDSVDDQVSGVWIIRASILEELSILPPPSDLLNRCESFQAPAMAARLSGRVGTD